MFKFKDFLELCRKTGYLSTLGAGPLGAQLAENLRAEWLHNSLNERGVNTLLAAPGHLEESLEYAQKLCGERNSFSLAHITPGTNPEALSLKNFEETTIEPPKFSTEQQFLLKTYTFVSPSSAQQVFHSQQKQRRIWWRKVILFYIN